MLPWRFRQVCSIIKLSFDKLGIVFYGFTFPGPAGDVPCFSASGDLSTEAEVRQKTRRKHAVITRRLVPLSGREPSPVELESRERSRQLLEQVFDDDNGEFK